MSDDSSKRGGRDRAEVAAGEPYEVEYFARKHGISSAQARQLIAEVGNDRARLDQAAAALTGGAGTTGQA